MTSKAIAENSALGRSCRHVPPNTTLAAAIGYLMKGAAESKPLQEAKDELLSAFGRRVRPDEAMEQAPQAPEVV
jgi:hypothetical protein